MKKLALLLAALSVASVSYAKEVMPVAEVAAEPAVEETVKAAPVLRVTSIGQYIEIDNDSSSLAGGAADIGESVHFGNKVGLALGDNWTFDLMARKTWSADTDDGMHSNGHRLDLSATRHFENFTLGMKWRGESGYDKFYIPVTYKFGMLSGWFEPAYVFYNTDGAQDAFYLEAEPVQVSYGPVQLAYYFEGEKETGDGDAHFYDHQVRLRGTVYSTERFTLGLEYRYQFASEHKEAITEKGVRILNSYKEYDRDMHSAIVSAAYDVTENLTVDGYYRYDFRSYDDETIKGTSGNVRDDDYYGEFYVGWTYKF